MRTLAISVNQTSKILGIGKTKIYELIEDGELESVKIGRRRLIKTKSIHSLLKGAK